MSKVSFADVDFPEVPTHAPGTRVENKTTTTSEEPVDKATEADDKDKEKEGDDAKQSACLSLLMHPVVIVLVLVLIVLLGFIMPVIDCWEHRSLYPAAGPSLACVSIIIFLYGGPAFTLTTTAGPASIQDLSDNEMAAENWRAVGWFVFGGLLMASYALPLIAGGNRLISMGASWASSVSVWFILFGVSVIIAVVMRIDRKRRE